MTTATERKIGPEAYRKHKSYMRKKQAAQRAEASCIGPIPEPASRARRDESLADYEAFKRNYHRPKFYLPPSPDHKRLADALVEAVLSDGTDDPRAFAFPRASGKTTEAVVATEWGVLRGSKSFPLLIGANQEKGEQLLTDIVSDLLYNDTLGADFPEVCFPLRALDEIKNRCKGQTYLDANGARRHTHITWNTKLLILPWVENVEWLRDWYGLDRAVTSQAAFAARGIFSKGLRGIHYFRKDTGEIVRPQLILLDDVQNDEGASSVTQCEKLERQINAVAKHMRGPKRPCSIFAPCTVLFENDVADKYTDPTRKPNWRGIRVPMLHSMPSNMKAWQKYFDRLDGLYADLDPSGERKPNTAVIEARNAYYIEQQAELEKGAVAAWSERFDDGEVSAIQHAMHFYYDSPTAFWSECQNDPKKANEENRRMLPALEMARKVNHLPRRVAPISTVTICAGLDIGKDYLFYTVAAFDGHFTVSVLDYDAYPKQSRRWFSKKDTGLANYHDIAKRQLGIGCGWEAALLLALEKVASDLCGIEWTTEDGRSLKLSRLLVDARWGESTSTVKLFCKRSQWVQVVPSLGYGFSPATRPLSRDKLKHGERVGAFWKLHRPQNWDISCVTVDTNRGKSHLHARWLTPIGDDGSLTLWKADPQTHANFCDHMHAERPETVSGRYGEMEKWIQLPSKPDNEGLDTLLLACVGASMEGIKLKGQEDAVRGNVVRTKTSAAEALAKR